MKKTSLFKIFFHPSFLFLLLCLIPGHLMAETKFVSGLIVVNVRDSFEKQAKIIGTVKSGDQLDILEEKNSFSHVKTQGNLEGWVPTHYLHAEAPTTETIIKLKEEILALKKRNEQLAASQGTGTPDAGLQDDQKKKLNQSLDSLKADNKRLMEDNQKLLRMVQANEHAAQTVTSEDAALKEKAASLQSQLDTLTNNSKNIIEITNERDRLASEVGALKTELAGVRLVNQKLESDKMYSWFFAGAAVFFVGLLSSKIFTRRKSKLTF